MGKLKVYYGWAKLGKIRKKRAISVIFENECHGCKWFYTRKLKGTKECFCTYSKNHQEGMKFGRIIGIHRIKSCNRKEIL